MPSVVVRWLPALVQSPTAWFDIAIKRVERWLDRRWVRHPAYEAHDWLTVVHELASVLPGWTEVLAEAPLKAIEEQVQRGRRDLDGQGPWHVGMNADLALARCLYGLARALQPETVVETGVGYGVSSAFILQALAVNGRGHLYSVDLPLPGRDSAHFTGALIPARLRDRWSLHVGTSRRLLPRLLVDQPLDLFVHDSSHTYLNMRREFAWAWERLRAGGVLVADDVECSQAFEELRARAPRFWRVARQEAKRALFGIAIK
ncbi:MAG: class I SAM-dependent methyltransferase [Chloroflexi bacterium]|mgnify:CR=1 FL=1|nr:class I SAM-dependent methyltransferase [Chloroflexota bacterium]